MDATRARLASAAAEWLLAAALICMALLALSFVLRQPRAVPTVAPVMAQGREPGSSASTPPAAVPSGAVSLPMLLLAGGRELRVGDTASEVAGVLGPNVQVGDDGVERHAGGERITRTYAVGGSRFTLVFEAAEPDASRVAAIYLR